MTNQRASRYVPIDIDWPTTLAMAARLGITIYRTDRYGDNRPIRTLNDLHPKDTK